jgi:hypothetical protein
LSGMDFLSRFNKLDTLRRYSLATEKHQLLPAGRRDLQKSHKSITTRL